MIPADSVNSITFDIEIADKYIPIKIRKVENPTIETNAKSNGEKRKRSMRQLVLKQIVT
jgi:hypothetical protein